MTDKETKQPDTKDAAQKDEKGFEKNEKQEEQTIDPGNEHNHLKEEPSKTSDQKSTSQD